MACVSGHVIQADAGAPIVMLAGMHPGCQWNSLRLSK